MRLHAFIAGTTNSGSGLLRGLLAQHPAVSTLPKEGHHYSRVLPRDRGPKTKRLFALYPKKFCMTERDVATRDVARLRNAFYRKWDRNREVLLEKSPHNALRLRFMNAVFVPAIFICLVRDGYAVAEGLRRRRGHDIARCARQWREANRIMRDDAAQVRHLVVRYEALVAEPQASVDRILAELGLASVPVDLSAPVRRQNMYGRPFPLGRHPDFDAESRARLTPNDRRIIRREAGGMLDVYGY
jgi:hypothetical protein